MPPKVICQLDHCGHGWLDLDEEDMMKNQKDHVARYHRPETTEFPILDTTYHFNRTKAQGDKYFCICKTPKDGFANPSSLKRHARGTTGKRPRGPCPVILDHARLVDKESIVFVNDSVTYYPTRMRDALARSAELEKRLEEAEQSLKQVLSVMKGIQNTATTKNIH